MPQCEKKKGLEPSGGSNGSRWREVTTENAEPREAETKHNPQKKKWQYAYEQCDAYTHC
jgi:hypothetical protein